MSDPRKYTVGWICAIEPEFVAAQAFLDEEHAPLESQDPQDSNGYALGKIGPHNVVIAGLPDGEYGTDSAAVVAKDMLRSFPCVRIGLMVGIGGGAPSSEHDIRLGDVVVSRPGGDKGGVFQYDFGKLIQDQTFLDTRFLNQPPDWLRTKVGLLKSRYSRLGHGLEEQINEVLRKWPRLHDTYSRPTGIDRLYKSAFTHQGGPGSNCESCGEDPDNFVMRSPRNERADNPAIHYGLIASGSKLMKDAIIRDKLAKEKNVLCFEMEAAGLMNHFPCLVIRGICDYSDSHKNKVWQGYAAMAAAAYARDLLLLIPPSKVASEATIIDKLSSVEGEVKSLGITAEMVKSGVDSANEQKIRDWFSTTPISTTYNISIKDRTPGTGQWLLSSETYKAWRDNVSGLLWLYGAAGSGKTVLCSTVVEDVSNHVQLDSSRKQAFWYFRFSDIATQSVSSMVRSFIRQLSPSPPLTATQKLWKEHSERGSEPALNELTGILDDIINDSKEVFVIIDALDECQQTTQLQERTSLLKYINTWLNRHKRNLHILVTSRVDHDIKSALEHYKAMKIEEWIDSDVRMYIEKQIHSGCLAEYQDSIKNKIKESLLWTKERRFRWVDLQIRRLSDCNTEDQIAFALRTVPETLEDLYKETLETIPLKDKKLAREILMWLCFSLQPMTVREISAAVGLLQPQNVLRICSTILVTLIHEDTGDIVQLAHFTVKEYLVIQRESNNVHEYQFTQESAQDTLARTTVNCLLSHNSLGHSALPQAPLLAYSARFWYEHAIVLEGKDEYKKLRMGIDRLFSRDYSRSYKIWLQMYDCDNPYALVYKSAREEKYPQPLYYASLLGFYHSVRKLLLEGERVKEEGRAGNTILAAVINGHETVVKEFLERLPPPKEVDLRRAIELLKRNAGNILSIYLKRYTFKITEPILMAAVQNEHSGIEILAILLDRRGEKIKITEKIVFAAARNKGCGKEIIMMLLNQRGEEIKITEKIVSAAARNKGCGKEIIMMLLNQRGEEIKITEKIVSAAARNEGYGKEIIMMLLNQRGEEIKITEEVVIAAVQNWQSGQGILAVLLNQRGGEIKITEEVVTAAVQNWRSGQEILMMLLDRKSEEIKITEEVVVAAAMNKRSGKEILTMLLDRKGEEIKITEEVVVAAAMNKRSGKEILTMLLNRRGEEIKITEGVVVAAAINEWSGKEILTMLLDRKGEEIKITEEVVVAAAMNEGSGKEILTMLLDRREDNAEIRELVLSVALINQKRGKEIPRMLLDRKGENIQLREALRTLAEENEESGKEILRMLLNRREEGIKITEKLITLAAENVSSDTETLTILLGQKGNDIKVTEKLLIAAARNKRKGRDVMAVLVDKMEDDIKVTAEVVTATSENPRNPQAIMVCLLSRKREGTKLTDDATAEIARRFDKFIFNLLLSRKRGGIRITEELMIAAAENELNGKGIMALLLNRKGKDIKITEGIMLAAVRNQCSGKEILTLLLERSGEDIQITDGLVMAAAENKRNAGHIKALLLDRLRKLNEPADSAQHRMEGRWMQDVKR